MSPQKMNRADISWPTIEKKFHDVQERFSKLDNLTQQTTVPATLRDSVHECNRVVADLAENLGIDYESKIDRAA